MFNVPDHLKKKLEQGHNDFLDDMLDGKPVMIVDSPGLRRQLRRRSIERMFEDRDLYNQALANHMARGLVR